MFLENNLRYFELQGGGRALRPLLHVHQLVPDARRGRLHRRRLRGHGRSSRRPPRREVAVAGGRADARTSSVRSWSTPTRRSGRSEPYDEAIAAFPATPIADEQLGRGDALLVGHDRAAEGHPAPAARRRSPATALALMEFVEQMFRFREGMTLPVAGAAVPLGAAGLACRRTMRLGGTAVIMERFDPEQYLDLVEQPPHHPQPGRADDVQPAAEAARRTSATPLRPVVARGDHPRRRAVPGAGQAGR